MPCVLQSLPALRCALMNFQRLCSWHQAQVKLQVHLPHISARDGATLRAAVVAASYALGSPSSRLSLVGSTRPGDCGRAGRQLECARGSG